MRERQGEEGRSRRQGSVKRDKREREVTGGNGTERDGVCFVCVMCVSVIED